MSYGFPDFDYSLIGGLSAGGETAVFVKRAGPVVLGEFGGQGFLAVDPRDPVERAEGHIRLAGVDAQNSVYGRFRDRDASGSPLKWPYSGTRYDAQGVAHQVQVLVLVGGVTFSGTELWAHIVELREPSDSI
jgi:hypothetical protein